MESITLAKAKQMAKEIRESNTSKFFTREIDSNDFCEKLASIGLTNDDIAVVMAGLRLAGAKFKKVKEKKYYGKI